jgi:hypothetical protein
MLRGMVRGVVGGNVVVVEKQGCPALERKGVASASEGGFRIVLQSDGFDSQKGKEPVDGFQRLSEGDERG